MCRNQNSHSGGPQGPSYCRAAALLRWSSPSYWRPDAAGGPIGRSLRWRPGGFAPRRRVRGSMDSTPSAACSSYRTTRAWTPRRLRGRLGSGRRPKRGSRQTSGLDGMRPRRRLSRRARTVSARTGQAPGRTRRASERDRRHTSYLTAPSDLGPRMRRRGALGVNGRPPGGSPRGNGSSLNGAGLRGRCEASSMCYVVVLPRCI